ncbi:MAG: class I SAM-dependent methyltransferase [Planctomycetes bacterium]|nr:class I SAM-dependent methyltransferase [Planctomycetota bacterium]
MSEDPTTPERGSREASRLSSLAGVRWNWNRLAEQDVTESIARRLDGGGTPWEREAFLAAGDAIVAELLARAAELASIDGPVRGGSVLDFGCGVGRMARALLERYEHYVGVDIAESMLARAPNFVASPRARFVHTPHGDLAPLGDARFDLVWSYVTLQHVPPDDARVLLGALARRVAPGGWLCVQVPTRDHTDPERIYGTSTWKGRVRAWLPRAWLERWRERRNGGPRCDMFGLAPEVVNAVLERAGLAVRAADVVDDTLGLVESRRYFATRPATTAR